jgi:lipoprotein-releasing system ATP-binding protein
LGTESAVWADSVTKIYRSGGTEVIVFRELSVDVCPGERLAIVGESGAGKSTLLHLLGGLDRPTSGRIFYSGRDITTLRERELADFRNREIGFVWQRQSLLPEFTALENVMMPLLVRGVDRDRAKESAKERLKEVGLSARQSHRSGELSGGEQQRIALARALAARPRVLLADEPTGNLDFRTGESIIAMLNDLHAAHGLTSVYVTHNVAFAQKCDRALELKKGLLYQPSLAELQEAGLVEQDATRLGGGTYV